MDPSSQTLLSQHILPIVNPHLQHDIIGLWSHFVLRYQDQLMLNIIFPWNNHFLLNISNLIPHKLSFIAGRNTFCWYSTTSGKLCPSKYKPFLWVVYLKPSGWNQQWAVANEMPEPMLRWIRGNNLRSMYFLRPQGISSTRWWIYLSATCRTNLFCVNLFNLFGSIAHLFEQT